MRTSRRQILQGLLAVAVLPGCKRKPPAPSLQVSSGQLDEPAVVHAWFDLPDDPRSRELSGISWEAQTRTLWAVEDEMPSIVSLLPDDELKTWHFGAKVTLDTSFPLDLEGVVVTPDSFIVASEIGPKIIEFARNGEVIRPIMLPAHFATARANKSLESLTMSADGKHLYTTSEWTLGCDGAAPTLVSGSHVRILRMDRDGKNAEEHAYMTDATPNQGGDYGVADLASLDENQLLVLERGWAPHIGNTARVYRVSLADPGTSCMDAASLDSRPTLKKELVVDLALLPAKGLPATRAKQPTPLMDNYEGMALGPLLPGGRRSLVLITDDNNRPDQVARILVLGLAL